MSIPRLKTPDSSLALLLEGYQFVGRRCRRLGTDAFRTRIMLQEIVCMSGAGAAELFYGGDRYTRKRGVPRPTLTLLQDFGSVQGLDDEPHRHRKAMFMAMMDRPSIERLAELSAERWAAAIARWPQEGDVVLLDEAHRVLCGAVCAWAGVPLGDDELERRARELAAVYDGAGAFGPRQVRGQLARRSVEAWAQDIVEGIRTGRLAVEPGAPAHAVATHRGLDGRPLTLEVAGVELLNLLRPTVAVGRFVVFAGLALHEHPAWRERLRGAGDDEVERFVQEVRRLAPFFPAVTGRVKRAHEWHGHRFAPGDWVLLDLYGTLRDPRAWTEPERFDPDRFRGWDGNPFTLVPQGGGDHATGHRCAGEWATIALLKAAVRALAEADLRVPEQDLGVRLSRMPARPASGLVLRAA